MSVLKFLFIIFISSITANVNGQELFEMLNNSNISYYEKVDNAELYFKNNGTEGVNGKFYKFYRRWQIRASENITEGGYVMTENSAAKILTQYHKNNIDSKNIKSDQNPWRNVGPFKWEIGNSPTNPGIGRINNFDVEPVYQQIIFAIGETGGVWKSVDAGKSWEAKGDNLEIMEVRGVGINPSNTDNVFIIDVDANVLKSDDGGDNWTRVFDGINSGISGTDRPLSIVFDPNNNNTILISTAGGILKSIDSGSTFAIISKDTIFEDILYMPGNSSIVYASGKSFYKSTDGGDSFSEITTGLKYAGEQRTKIAVTPANPNLVMLIQANMTDYMKTTGAIYKSTNSGDSFEMVYDVRNGSDPDLLSMLGYRNMTIAINNTDATMVFVGGQFEHWRSTNSAESFTSTGDWSVSDGIVPDSYVHADIETAKYINGVMYIGCDGGLFMSSDNQTTFEDLTQNGISVRQFYRIGLCKSDANLVGGGSQDCGVSLLKGPDKLSMEWEGGDGYEVLIDYNDPNIMYATDYLSSSISKTINGGKSRIWLSGMPTGGSADAFDMDPVDPKTLYRGFGDLYKNTNQGEANKWINISSSIPNTGNVSKLAVAQSNNNYIYIVKKIDSYSFKVWLSKNAQDVTPDWQEIASSTSRINYITVNPNNPDMVAYITTSGTVKKSDDAGVTWGDITKNLPSITGKTLAFDNKGNNGLYVGMYKGIYYINSDASQWTPFSKDLPNVQISEIEIHHSANKIVVGTYGRGAWEADLIEGEPQEPIANFSANKTSVVIDENVIFTDKSSYEPTSWLWQFEGGTPSESQDQNPIVVYKNEGNYKVSLTVTNALGSNAIEKEAFINVEKATDIQSLLSKTNIVYPNPVANTLEINLPISNVSVNIYNTQGKIYKRVVTSGLHTSINVSSLPSGMYIVEIKMANQTIRKQIIKQ